MEDSNFLAPATNTEELSRLVRESVGRGFTAYTLQPEHTPQKLKEDIAKLFESSRGTVLGYINNRLKDVNNFDLDIQTISDLFPNFEVAVNKANGRNVINFKLATKKVMNGETSVKADQHIFTSKSRGPVNE
jgi:hypothetical protein